MCGFLGGNNTAWDFEAGIDSISHRGPDGKKICRYQYAALAFARLSVIDLSNRAMQPMDGADDRVHIVFNGEIYGYEQLKRDLSKEYSFRTTSDTEVILNAYLKYGETFVDHIDGMFAIAILDERDGTFRLFRDRAGIKPLYYLYDGKNFAFSSELKGIVQACPAYPFELDYTALYDYLFYQYIPEPKSMYKNVYKLQPAHQLTFDIKEKKILEKKKYWKLHVNTRVSQTRKTKDVQEEFRYLIRKSVKEQMIADVLVGTFLSGGVDSSIVTYEASRINPGIEAFCIGFCNQAFDESRYAKLLTEQYDLNLTARMLSHQDLMDIKGNLKKWYDEPFSDTSAYPTYLVSKLAREKVTVVLTGDGGDELFGGYERYGAFVRQRETLKFKNPKIYKLLLMLHNECGVPDKKFYDRFKTEIDLYFELMGFGFDGVVSKFAKQWKIDKYYEPRWHFYRYDHKDLPPITRLRYLDFKTYLPGAVLTKVDRASMQVSLEARVPFLSRELMEFAFSLSQEDCCALGELKGCAKYAYQGVLPDEILFRKKMGFAVTSNSLSKELRAKSLYAGVLKNEWPGLYAAYNR